MRLFLGLLFVSFVLFFASFVITPKVFASPICGGTYVCKVGELQCNTPDGLNPGCDPFAPVPPFPANCTCAQVCSTPPGTPDRTNQCNVFSTANCDFGHVQTSCDISCGPPGGATVSNGCFVQNDACIGDSQCPSYPNQQCCGGSPNYCSTVGYTCGGVLIATPTPATPCPGGTSNCANATPTNYAACSGTPTYMGNAGYDSWCSQNAGAGAAYCWSCNSTTACPVNPPSGGTNTCVSGASCPSGKTIYGSPSNNACGAGMVCCNAPAAGTPTPTTAPTPTGVIILSSSCPNIDNDGRSNVCNPAGFCPFGYTYKNVTTADNACTTSGITLDPNCPLNDTDNRPNSCANVCPGTTIAKGGAADAACVAAGLGNFCCHSYAPKWCCHQNAPATPTPIIPTSVPLPTATPIPVKYTLTAHVFVDSGSGTPANDDNGFQNCSGACDNGAGDEKNYSGASLVIVPGGTILSTGANGNATFNNLVANNYGVTLTVPIGYRATTLTTRSPVPLPPSTTVNFGIDLAPPTPTLTPTPTPTPTVGVFPPTCPGGISANPSNVAPGGTSTLSVTNCSTPTPTPPFGSTPTPTPTVPVGSTPTPTVPFGSTPTPTPEIFNWTPPTGSQPQCSDGIDNDGDGLIDTADPGCHTDGDTTNPGSYNPNDDSEANPSNSCQDSGTGSPTNSATSSTVTWTAPSCPTAPLVCQASVVVSSTNGGGSSTYNTILNVPATFKVVTNVRSVPDASSCTPVSGSGLGGTKVNVTDNNTINSSQTTDASGTITYACLPNGDYQATIFPPSGFVLVGTNGGTSSSGNTINIKPLSGDSTITFCVESLTPWFQTTQGDVRYLNLSNPVPPNQYGSTGDANGLNPGIFYSSNSNATIGPGSASAKNWVVNNEYFYNADTENRNGGMSYDFYKSQAKQEGVKITQISDGTLDMNQLPVSGVYEVKDSGNITSLGASPIAIAGKHIVILASGNVTIDEPVSVAQGNGLLVIAAKGDINIDSSIGTPDPIGPATLAQKTTQLDGYYTAQGSVIINSIGSGCADGLTSDKRLNVGGALVANSLKPFATSGANKIQNKRSLCTNNPLYPTLYISSRPDFLTQLTDFYKTSYTKWQEVNP